MSITAPTDISSCYIWIDASDSSTLNVTGATLNAWNDKSGNLHHFVADGGNPTVAGTLNGLAVVDFATNGRMFPNGVASGGVATTATVQPVTVVVVTRIESTTWGGVFSGAFGSTEMQVRRRGDDNTKVEFFAGTSAQYTVDKTNFHLFTAVFNGASSQQRIDSVQVGTTNTGTSGWSSDFPRLGTDNDNNYFDGQIAEMAVYTKALNSTEITDIEAYMNAKWFAATGASTVTPRRTRRTYQLGR